MLELKLLWTWCIIFDPESKGEYSRELKTGLGISSVAATCMELLGYVPICPEIYGGRPTPRTPSEIKDGRVVMKDGTDVTVNFCRGAKSLADMANSLGAKMALLKERSPSCGYRFVYDGSFSATLIEGSGIFASELLSRGFSIYTEDDIDSLI